MLEVRDMTAEEMEALLRRAPYGHLGVARDGHPYVVPMNYAYEDGVIYFVTTEGTKTEFINANREVCLQVEEVIDFSDWRSVMVTGRAERLRQAADTERAMQALTRRNPQLAPTLNQTRIGPWTRRGQLAVYRIRPAAVYGRQTKSSSR